MHFAVDPDEAWMTTRLSGRQTRFLPFNRGRDRGAGNPPAAPGKYRTSYLWDEVLPATVSWTSSPASCICRSRFGRCRRRRGSRPSGARR